MARRRGDIADSELYRARSRHADAADRSDRVVRVDDALGDGWSVNMSSSLQPRPRSARVRSRASTPRSRSKSRTIARSRFVSPWAKAPSRTSAYSRAATCVCDRPAAGLQRGLQLDCAEAVPRRRVVDEVGAVAVHEASACGRHEGKVLLARRLGGRRLGLERDAAACAFRATSPARAGGLREIWPRQVRPRRPRRGLGRPFPGLGHRSGRVGRRRREVARRDRSAAAAARAVDLDPAVLVRPVEDLDHFLGVGVDLPRLVRLMKLGRTVARTRPVASTGSEARSGARRRLRLRRWVLGGAGVAAKPGEAAVAARATAGAPAPAPEA